MKTREKLEAAKKKTSFEIAELKERLKASRETINCLKMKSENWKKMIRQKKYKQF